VLERLRSYYLEGGTGGPAGFTTTGEQLDAVLASDPRSPLDLDARLRALAGFLVEPAAAALTAANKRIANILRKSDAGTAGAVDAALLREPAERALAAALARVRAPVEQALAQRDYAAALATLAQLRGEVDAFFDAVMVNDPDAALRANRLALLSSLAGLFGRIADLSKLPG
jgi:glycyl-tRNA synthetase beta chain